MFCRPGFNYFEEQLKKSEYNYLEIGVFNGDSIAILAQKNPNLMIYGIDPFIEDGYTTHATKVQRSGPLLNQKLNTLRNIGGLSNVKLFEMTSKTFANQLTDEQVAQMNVAWVLIDGSHHYEDVIIDVKLALRLIGSKLGGIVFDDLFLPAVRQAYNEFIELTTGCISPLINLHKNVIIAHFINCN